MARRAAILLGGMAMTSSDSIKSNDLTSPDCDPTWPEARAFGGPVARLLGEVGTVQHLRRGQPLRRDGQTETHFWVVRQGVLSSVVELQTDRRCVLAFHYPGDLIAGPSEVHPRAVVQALADVEVRRLQPSVVQHLMATDADFAMSIVNAMSKQAGRLSLHCAMLGRLSGEERLVTLLIEMASHLGRRIADRVDVHLPIGREDIADYLGLNADTVSRNFSRLRRDGLIELDGRSHLHILNWERLVALSPFGSNAESASRLVD